MSEPTFTILDSDGKNLLDETKKKILETEKENAVNMIKTASFREGLQDPYPSPFLNLSDLKIPERAVEIFKWCRYFYMFDPLVAGAINSLATFPVTDVYLEDIDDDDEEESEMLKTYKRVLFKKLNIHKLLIEIGIDYWLYGNCFIFGEMEDNKRTGEKEWKHVIRLDPSKVVIDVNPATQEKKYKWRVPERIQRIVKNQRPKEEYDKIPEMIKKAVRGKKLVVLNSNNIYHFAKPTDSMGDSVWGTPTIANILKLLMYRNILRQAQEAIAREHIVPFRVYYFQKIEDYNPNVQWGEVAKNFAAELKKAAKDPNHKVISPVPVNVLNIGGQGRALLLTPEIEQIQAEILAGMNVPREFIFGGISYSGSSISLKILENHFITYRLLLKDFMQNFLIRGMAKARKEWITPEDDNSIVTVKMTELKMQDDVQQKQLVINLNGAGKVTDEYMWKILGIDPDKMRERLEKELMAKIELESKAQLERVKWGVEIQKAQLKAQMEIEMYKRQLQQEMQSKFGINPMTEQQGNEINDADTQMVVDDNTQTDIISNIEDDNKIQQQEKPQPEIDQTINDIEQTVGGNKEQSQGQGGMSQLDMQKLAIQLLQMPKANADAVLSKFPEVLRQQILAMMDTMKSSMPSGAKDGQDIDMRPMPEVKPPRRDSLK